MTVFFFYKTLFLIAAYIIGSIPVGYIIFKIKKGGDIRNEGSGNVGGTNVTRTLGAGAGLATVFLDVLKGFLPVAVSYFIFPGDFIMPAASAVAAVTGHDYPVFLKFKGGKGISSSYGVILAFCSFPFTSVSLWLRILPIFIVLLTWVIVFLSTRIVSVSSLAAAIVLPPSFYFTGQSLAAIVAVSGLSLLTFIAHRDNIKRLIRKEEKRLKRKGA